MPDRSLSLTDASAAMRLLSQFGALREDLISSQRRLLVGLAGLVGADAWVWALQAAPKGEAGPVYFGLIEGGWADERQKRTWLESAFSSEFQELLRPLAERSGEHRTFTRSELMPDERWYGSDFYRKYRAPVGLDDLLLSWYPPEPDVESTIRLHRSHGRRPFGERERDLVHLVTGSIDWLHAAAIPDAGMPEIPELSRRERQVLALLLAGDGVKQVAAKLGLSEHTVIQYNKELHRHFGVHSRGELLARFIPPEVLEGLRQPLDEYEPTR